MADEIGLNELMGGNAPAVTHGTVEVVDDQVERLTVELENTLSDAKSILESVEKARVNFVKNRLRVGELLVKLQQLAPEGRWLKVVEGYGWKPRTVQELQQRSTKAKEVWGDRYADVRALPETLSKVDAELGLKTKGAKNMEPRSAPPVEVATAKHIQSIMKFIDDEVSPGDQQVITLERVIKELRAHLKELKNA